MSAGELTVEIGDMFHDFEDVGVFFARGNGEPAGGDGDEAAQSTPNRRPKDEDRLG
jgi:hypothetical protein